MAQRQVVAMQHEVVRSDFVSETVTPRVSKALGAVAPAYFDEAAGVARSVFAEASWCESYYAFGPLTCRIRYANREIYAILHRAYAHLVIPEPSAPDLRIDIWDTAQSRHVLPEPHEIMLLYYRNHCLALCSDARYLALDERWLCAKSYIDRQQGTAYYGIANIHKLPCYQQAAPIRSVLNALFGPRGGHLVHAAAVGTSRGGVLLPGAAGAGKSTTALSCLGGELRYLADDWCGVWAGDPPQIFSAYNSAKLRLDNLDRFPDLHHVIVGHDAHDEDKATLFLAEHQPDWLLRSCPARAILLPEVSGCATTSFEPAPRKQAWNTMLTWTLSQIPGCEPNSAAALMTRLSAQLPAFRLKLGTNRTEVKDSLENFVAKL